MTTVLKLGGSVITEKDAPETIDEEALDRAVAAITESNVEDIVVVHGGGSFGHYHASEHGISTTEGSHDAAVALAVHDAMKRLNAAVVSRLQERGVPALPVHPLSGAHRDGESELFVPLQAVRTLLAEGFVPVTHGDLVAHEGAGVTVVSGDELVVTLASGLDADRLGLCSAVPGVLDEEGSVVAEISSYEAVADVLGGSDATDVTGGMAGKVATLVELTVPAAIFGLDDLEGFLAGERVGTTVAGR
jgi:isopentenyl phosphate kinase